MKKIQRGQSLGSEESRQLVQAIFQEQLTEIQIAALLMGLSVKGESVGELVGFVLGMREYAVHLNHPHKNLVDTAGTGGDGSGTFNISTAAAIVIAGAGVPVAKHGNRAISGKCGSADVLTRLGVNISAPREVLEDCLTETGITFLFAPAFHPAMKIVGRVRKELGVRTIFNLMGPLLNPAGARRQIIGVYAPHLTELVGEALQQLGSEHALIFCGEEGLDELGLDSKTKVTELRAGKIETRYLTPEVLGFSRRSVHEYSGGEVEENAAILHEILTLKRHDARREIVILNAAAGIYVAGVAASIADGVALARQSLDSGAALGKLTDLVEYTNGRKVRTREVQGSHP
ncbi:MAG: anthranilate phosphoribosyltransferase [Terriglobia bacterium]